MIQIHDSQSTKFFMLVGLPGSGKSTYIEKYYSNYCVHSSDAIREELFGDASIQENSQQVFETLHKRVKADLMAGKSVVYDATNISWKRRKAFLTEISKIPCYKCCVLMATPFEVCVDRQFARDRQVPYKVIERMYKNFDIPWHNEGWDNITIAYTDPDYYHYLGHWSDFMFKHINFNQESKWHSESLGTHCQKCCDYVLQNVDKLTRYNEKETVVAAALHDCGKPFCKAFKDSKGNDSEFAHYYNHENVGAYDSLFYGKDRETDNLLVAALIRYHMVLHFFKDWNNKTIDKYEKEFTSHKWLKEMEFYDALKLLHEGDKKAH